MTVRFTIYLAILLLVFLRGLWGYKNLSAPFKVLCVLMGASFFSETTSRLLAVYMHNSMPVYHLFSLLQYTGFALMYYLLLQHQKTKRIILYSLPFMIALGLLNTFFLQSLNQFPSNFLILMFTILIVFTMMLFKQFFEEAANNIEQKKSILYFNCALLIYAVVVLLNFGLTNYFLRRDIDNKIGRDVVYYVTVLFYSLIGGLFSMDRNPKPSYEK